MKNIYRILFLMLFIFLSISPFSFHAEERTTLMQTTANTIFYTSPHGTQTRTGIPIPQGATVILLETAGQETKVEWEGQAGFIENAYLLEKNSSQADSALSSLPARSSNVEMNSYFQLLKDAEIYQKRNGQMIKSGRMLTGEVWKKKSSENGYISFIFGNGTAYVKEVDTVSLSSASLPSGVEQGQTYSRDILIQKTASLLYMKNGQLSTMARLVPGTKVKARATFNDFYIINIGGRSAYVRKTDAISYTGNYVDPFKTITYQQMVQDLKELTLWHPDIASLQIIGKSVDGRDLYALKLGTGKEELMISASHHAREHITTNVVMEIADQYAHLSQTNGTLNNYKVKSILQRTSIYFVPMVNPDGVSLVQLGAGSAKNKAAVLKLNRGSTNFSAWKANIRGVDLNRQYPANWNNICCDPGKPSSQNYKGPKPLSEPEAKAMYDFTLKHSFKASAAYHSSGQIIYWHFHQSGARKSRDLSVARRVSQKTGYSLVAPQPNPSGGGYTDWFIQNEQKPGLTIEVSPYVGNRPVPLIYFSSIWKQNNSVGLMLANETIQ